MEAEAALEALALLVVVAAAAVGEYERPGGLGILYPRCNIDCARGGYIGVPLA